MPLLDRAAQRILPVAVVHTVHHLVQLRAVESGLRALERGIARRSRRITAPAWVGPVVPLRHVAQRVIELKPLPHLVESLEIARTEQVGYTTEQPSSGPATLGSRESA